MILLKILIGFISMIFLVVIGFLFVSLVIMATDAISKKLRSTKIHILVKILRKILNFIWNAFLVLFVLMVTLVLSFDFGDSIINLLK